MASPSGTIRTKVNRQLVDLIGGLDGFSVEPERGSWWVTRPPNGQLKNRRTVVIGVGTGTVEEDGIAAGHGPSIDDWLIGCFIEITDEPDVELAEQACEDAFNAIADLLAADSRIGMNPGPRSVRVNGDFEMGSGQEAGKPLFAYLAFTIAAAADIERNQP